MAKPSFGKWIRYQFDNLMAKSSIAPLLLLIAVVVLSIGLLSITVYLTGAIPYDASTIDGIADPENITLLDVIYVTVLRMLDPGTIAGDPIKPWFIAFMMISTLGGLVIISIFIAIVNNAVLRKIDDLRKGKSEVLESGHTIILGWSFQVFPVISELIIANENQKNESIVILAEQDKVYMEDQIKSHVGDTKSTKIVCRTGNPIDIHDLGIINLNDSKSIIIIAPDIQDPDSAVIKTILAITNSPLRKKGMRYHIVAEIRDPRNVTIARIAGSDEVQLVVFDYLISRITAQTCRQPGLSVVFTELLDFSGDEIYFQAEPQLTGRTFVEAMFSYETSSIVGIRKSDGTLLMKPSFDTIIEKGDKLIAISEDDDTVVLSNKQDYSIATDSIRKDPKDYHPQPEATLIIGWNRRAPLIIKELDQYVANGSRITLLAENQNTKSELEELSAKLENQTIDFKYGDSTNRQTLESLAVQNYDHIIVLSITDGLDVQQTDARTLNTLLHLREMSDIQGHQFAIVSEMLDDRNRELAEITNTDDFIVSVKLDSLMLAQISENLELRSIFEDLFSAGPPSIYIMPAEFYVDLNRAVNFYTVMESARQQNQIAIGYKLQNPNQTTEDEVMLAYGVVVNPKKSNQVFFSSGDKIVVLSDEDLTTWIN